MNIKVIVIINVMPWTGVSGILISRVSSKETEKEIIKQEYVQKKKLEESKILLMREGALRMRLETS